MKQSLKEQFHVIDKGVFIVSWLSLLLIALPIILFPEQSQAIVSALNSWVLGYLGAPYMIFGLFCLGFCLYVSYSRYGRIRLGDEDEEPEFKTFSWAAMLFCCGVGAGVVYWGFIEWAYYFQAPPLGLTTDSWQAAEMATAYGYFSIGGRQHGLFTQFHRVLSPTRSLFVKATSLKRVKAAAAF